MQLIAHPDRTREIASVLEEDDRALIEGFLGMSPVEFSQNFRVTIKSTEQNKTEEALKQALLTLTQLYTMYGQQMFQLLPIVYAQGSQVPQEVKLAASKFIVGGTKLIERTFVQMDNPDTDDYLLYVKDLEMMLEALEAQKDQQISQMRRAQNGNQ